MKPQKFRGIKLLFYLFQSRFYFYFFQSRFDFSDHAIVTLGTQNCVLGGT